ncbi:MAG: tyrosine--tRNA ligase [Chloroflexi bacterium]|nr:MAG: tyrosine--tRNA ligase [Actinobacteria bacterium 13_2_20CM_2_66_6]TMF78364.1 MAG: tyrosine--tRNA ligase [Chloroflexota bacterium]TMF78854.1 MAG: tyrosine--tRNA ligase [Chloroflexota bacterium]TMF92403.1 MAG: tyrosine--tRNA ligase [Chloroflexota bacterium]TMG44840.1 MAG: tyrosine--tRNA ligase [Chloroflexota bacterium]
MSRELFQRLRERAVQIHVEDHLRARLERGDRLRVKLGLDPTAPDLHVGHLVVLDVLRDFQDDGHTVVLIIGDYTALIGDPSGRSETRPMLTEAQVAANAETYFQQLSLVLDRKLIEVRHNSEWLAAMTAADILRLMAKATLQQVLQREDFADRMKAGTAIGAHEVLYPFSQAYDSVAIKADLEVGGTDQLFNLLFGREIQKSYGQEPQDIAVFPLLEGTDGEQKMSKSLGNYIGISEPPEQIYGKTMSIPDRLIEKYVRLISGFEATEQADVLSMKPRDAKAALARQLVKRLHGEEAAKRAEEDFNIKFRKREIPEGIEERTVTDPRDLVMVLVETGLRDSRGDARRLIEQGGVRINGQKAGADAILKDGDVLQAGKRSFVRIRVG